MLTRISSHEGIGELIPSVRSKNTLLASPLKIFRTLGAKLNEIDAFSSAKYFYPPIYICTQQMSETVIIASFIYDI